MNQLTPHHFFAINRARDVLSGEDAIKAAGTKYLPRLDSQSDAEYEAYKTRASFLGATSRTLEEYLDLVFRRPPQLKLSEPLQRSFAVSEPWGESFETYTRRTLREVLSVGRAGTLVQARPGAHFSRTLFQAEDILSWNKIQDDTYSVTLRKGGASIIAVATSSAQGLQASDFEAGIFVFHGPTHSRPDPIERLPLADIIAANLDHYRLDADYKHALHFAALPTAWVSGFDKETALRIGSSNAWVSEVPGATAGFLEFSGAAIQYIERALDRAERHLALLGAKLLEPQETENQPKAEPRLCGLAEIVASLNQSITQVLRFAHCCVTGSEPAPGEVTFALNTDLAPRHFTAAEITAVVEAWRAGAISRDTMLARLKQADVLPSSRSVAEERALLHRQ